MSRKVRRCVCWSSRVRDGSPAWWEWKTCSRCASPLACPRTAPWFARPVNERWKHRWPTGMPSGIPSPWASAPPTSSSPPARCRNRRHATPGPGVVSAVELRPPGYEVALDCAGTVLRCHITGASLERHGHCARPAAVGHSSKPRPASCSLSDPSNQQPLPHRQKHGNLRIRYIDSNREEDHHGWPDIRGFYSTWTAYWWTASPVPQGGQHHG